MDGMKKHLLHQSEPSKLTFVGEEVNGRFNPKMVRHMFNVHIYLFLSIFRIIWYALLVVLWH